MYLHNEMLQKSLKKMLRNPSLLLLSFYNSILYVHKDKVWNRSKDYIAAIEITYTFFYFY